MLPGLPGPMGPVDETEVFDPIVTFLTSVTSGSTVTTNASSFSFTSVTFGGAASDRQIFVVISSRHLTTGENPTGVTIGGVTAVQVAGGTNSAEAMSIWRAAVPTGTTGTVAVTYTNIAMNCAISVYRATGLNSLTAYNTKVTNFSASTTCDLQIATKKGGFVISGLTGYATSTAWTNSTENLDTVVTDNAGTVSLLASLNDITNTTTYTFSSVSFGAADPTRIIVVVESGTRIAAAGQSASTVTIGGVSATNVATANIVNTGATGAENVAIWAAAVPTGTSGNIVVTYANSHDNCGIQVYRLIDCTSVSWADAQDTEGNFTTSWSSSITSLTDGVAVMGCNYGPSSKSVLTYTGINANTNDMTITDGGNVRKLAASADGIVTGSSLTIGMTFTGTGTAGGSFAAACFTCVRQSHGMSSALMTGCRDNLYTPLSTVHGSGTGLGVAVAFR